MMSYENRRWTILDLMEAYAILVPALQRNYVHGREDVHAEEVRTHFVDGVVQCAKKSKEMHLDIVYGTVEDRDKILIPIDGQQRLTTLWLIAVYCAQVGVGIEDLKRVKTLDNLSRFSYEARPLASTFCRWLTSRCNFDNIFAELDDARRMWGEDPTVSAMITTLKLIIDKIGKADVINAVADVVLWQHDKAVTFDFRPIPGDATDLYVKINARGKALTQWENFKGKFSECLIDKDQRTKFEQKIEELCELYFNWTHEHELPDSCFVALFGRVIEYWLSNNPKNNPPEKVGERLIELSKANPQKKLPYVPVDEFELDRSAPATCTSLLRLIEWGLENSSEPFPYWRSDRSIAQVLFSPENANERDFSLVLFEYFNVYNSENQCLSEKNCRALRLIANILENVERASPGAKGNEQFNRIVLLGRFMDVPCLYRRGRTLAHKEPLQYDEECAKGDFYAEGAGNADLLDEVERMLHGRARIAFVNLETWQLATYSDFNRRASCLKSFVSSVTLPDAENSETRWSALCELVKCLPRDIGREHIPINLSDAWRDILMSRFDSHLQKSFVDGIPFDKETPLKLWERDWRTTTAAFIKTDVPDRNAKWHVQWHYGTGTYYLYWCSKISGAKPVSDWRFDLREEDSLNILRELGEIESVVMNDGGTRNIPMNTGRDDERINVYLWKEGVEVRWFGYGRKGEQLSESVRMDLSQNVSARILCDRVKDLVASMREHRSAWDDVSREDLLSELWNDIVKRLVQMDFTAPRLGKSLDECMDDTNCCFEKDGCKIVFSSEKLNCEKMYVGIWREHYGEEFDEVKDKVMDVLSVPNENWRWQYLNGEYLNWSLSLLKSCSVNKLKRMDLVNEVVSLVTRTFAMLKGAAKKRTVS